MPLPLRHELYLRRTRTFRPSVHGFSIGGAQAWDSTRQRAVTQTPERALPVRDLALGAAGGTAPDDLDNRSQGQAFAFIRGRQLLTSPCSANPLPTPAYQQQALAMFKRRLASYLNSGGERSVFTVYSDEKNHRPELSTGPWKVQAFRRAGREVALPQHHSMFKT